MRHRFIQVYPPPPTLGTNSAPDSLHAADISARMWAPKPCPDCAFSAHWQAATAVQLESACDQVTMTTEFSRAWEQCDVTGLCMFVYLCVCPCEYSTWGLLQKLLLFLAETAGVKDNNSSSLGAAQHVKIGFPFFCVCVVVFVGRVVVAFTCLLIVRRLGKIHQEGEKE